MEQQHMDDGYDNSLSRQVAILISSNTLGAIETLLAGDSNPGNDAQVQMWLDRAWQTINDLGSHPTQRKAE